MYNTHDSQSLLTHSFCLNRPKRLSQRVTKWWSYLSGVACILATSCAPGLGTHIELNPEVAFETLHEEALSEQGGDDVVFGKARYALCNRSVSLFAIQDERSRVEILRVGDRPVKSVEPVAKVTQEMFERVLIENGYTLEPESPLQLTARVVELFGVVNPDFPTSSVTSQARVEVTAVSKELTPLYRATFKGNAGRTDPFLGEEDIQGVVSMALLQALREAASSSALCSALGE